jgi:hypothetical protein
MTTSPYLMARTTPRRTHPVLRALLAVVAMIGAVLGALVTAFAASITWTGCFIECSGEDHVGGALLGLLAAAVLAAGPLAVAGLYSSRAWLRAAGAAFAVVLVLVVLMLGAG